MAKRKRRRRSSGAAAAVADRPSAEERAAGKESAKLRQQFEDNQQKISKRRTIIGALGFIPLAATLIPCGSAGPLDIFCMLDRQWWLLIWAAIFGSFLGLTIRMILERRRFARGTWRAPSA